MTRLFSLLAAAAVLLVGNATFAQTKPTQDQLDRMMTLALQNQTAPVRFANPQIMGFYNVEVVTQQLGYKDGDNTYYFAVTTPRLNDGLFFFVQKPGNFFAMHRTDTHLRRVASARNSDGKLTVWAGADADTDMAQQLRYWAGKFR